MFKTLKKNFFPFIIACSALSVSASAAFYSVFGLSKLFAGASFEVIIMAGSLEVAKLVIASLLYQYWDTINKWLRTYLTIAAVVLVIITSMGIYGFLSAAYQETYSKLVVNENQIEFLENKAQFYQQDIERYDKELARISDNINVLSNARSQSIQVRDTTSSTGFRNTISTSELRMASKRIEVEEENRKFVQAKREVAADSLQTYRFQILELNNDADTVGELGPLKYLSDLTDTPMDKIINILLLVIIFVFDPLAISLVVAANFAFDVANKREDDDLPVGPEPDDDPEDGGDYYDDYDDYYDEAYDEGDWNEGILDEPTRKEPPFDVSADPEAGKGWFDLADQIAEESAKMKDEEEFDHLKDFVDIEEDQRQDTAFMDFQKKIEKTEEELKLKEIEVVDPEEVSSKFEVEDTAGNVEVYEESKVDNTEMETDRVGTFPNENNPTSVAAVVKNLPNEFGTYPSTVEKIETPHLPKEDEKPIQKIVKKESKATIKKQEISEDELFDIAMRKKAEEDKQQFLRDRDGNSKK